MPYDELARRRRARAGEESRERLRAGRDESALDLDPRSAYELLTRQMVASLTEELREIRPPDAENTTSVRPVSLRRPRPDHLPTGGFADLKCTIGRSPRRVRVALRWRRLAGRRSGDDAAGRCVREWGWRALRALVALVGWLVARPVSEPHLPALAWSAAGLVLILLGTAWLATRRRRRRRHTS